MHDKLNMINNVQINRKVESKFQIINKGVHLEEWAISSTLADKLFSELKGVGFSVNSEAYSHTQL